jgi:hypothetical protein
MYQTPYGMPMEEPSIDAYGYDSEAIMQRGAQEALRRYLEQVARSRQLEQEKQQGGGGGGGIGEIMSMFGGGGGGGGGGSGGGGAAAGVY